MLNLLFSGIFTTGSVTLGSFCLSIATALVLGAVLTLVYSYKSENSKSFTITLAMLPATVGIVIMLVNGNLGAGVAVAGTFSLVRFRSAPGTAREIGAIFLTMAVGLACGMGYIGFAVLFTVIMCLINFIYMKLGFGEKKNAELRKTLCITVPEDLDYGGIFDDLFTKYTSQSKLIKVKTTNLGSLNKLTYDVTLKDTGTEKSFIDELRCRNGNLEISSSLRQMDSREL